MQRFIVIGFVATLAGCAAHPTLRPGGPPERGRGQLFISPMGEPFRSTLRPGAAQSLWFEGMDRDATGRVTLAAFQRDAARFFAVLDRGKDGEIDPGDLDYYETVLVPEIRVTGNGRGPGPGGSQYRGGGGGGGGGGRGGSRGGGGPGGGGQGMKFGGADGGDGGDKAPSAGRVRERLGAARFGFFDLPEPVIAADRSGNRGVDATEFAAAAATRFAVLDRNHDGALTRGELPRAGAETWRNGSDRPADMPDARPGAVPRDRTEP